MFESWESPRKSKLMATMPILHTCQLAGYECFLSGEKKNFTCNTHKSHILLSCLTFLFHSQTQLNNYSLKFLCGLINRSGHLAMSNFSCCFRAAKKKKNLQSSLSYTACRARLFSWSPRYHLSNSGSLVPAKLAPNPETAGS